MERIALINVGANASHGGLRSIRFPDGTFEFFPIPDRRYLRGPTIVRYRDLASPHGRNLLPMLPKRYHNLPAHYDPEFESFTYGDYPRHGRAGHLRQLRPGDLLFFVGRLVDRREGRRLRAGFYLVGFLEIEEVLRNVVRPPPPEVSARFLRNAHVRRAMADRRLWDGFWAFRGSPSSRRFRVAVPFNRRFAVDVMRTAKGSPWTWPRHRTELQTIASYTRTCRILEADRAPERLLGFLAHIHASGEDMTRWLLDPALLTLRALAEAVGARDRRRP